MGGLARRSLCSARTKCKQLIGTGQHHDRDFLLWSAAREECRGANWSALTLNKKIGSGGDTGLSADLFTFCGCLSDLPTKYHQHIQSLSHFLDSGTTHEPDSTCFPSPL